MYEVKINKFQNVIKRVFYIAVTDDFYSVKNMTLPVQYLGG